MPSKKSPRKPAAKAAPARKPTKGAAKKTAATRVAVEPVQAAAAANQETADAVLKAGTQVANKGYEQAVAIAQEQVEKASQNLFGRYDDAASFSKETVDACVLSSTVFAKGLEAMSKELMGIAQSTVEANIVTTQALFGATSMRELIDLQTEFSRNRFESLVADSAKLTELSLSLANEAMEPIQSRMNATVEKLMKPVAA